MAPWSYYQTSECCCTQDLMKIGERSHCLRCPRIRPANPPIAKAWSSRRVSWLLGGNDSLCWNLPLLRCRCYKIPLIIHDTDLLGSHEDFWIRLRQCSTAASQIHNSPCLLVYKPTLWMRSIQNVSSAEIRNTVNGIFERAQSITWLHWYVMVQKRKNLWWKWHKVCDLSLYVIWLCMEATWLHRQRRHEKRRRSKLMTTANARAQAGRSECPLISQIIAEWLIQILAMIFSWNNRVQYQKRINRRELNIKRESTSVTNTTLVSPVCACYLNRACEFLKIYWVKKRIPFEVLLHLGPT